MPGTLVVKQGASFQLTVAAQNNDGTPVNLTQATLTSQVRDAYGNLIANLTLMPTTFLGQYSITEPTTVWPPGDLVWDIKIVQAGLTLISETAGILVIPAVTM